MIENLVTILVTCAVIPVVVYISVKLGTYAFYRGKQLFEKENRNNGAK